MNLTLPKIVQLDSFKRRLILVAYSLTAIWVVVSGTYVGFLSVQNSSYSLFIVSLGAPILLVFLIRDFQRRNNQFELTATDIVFSRGGKELAQGRWEDVVFAVIYGSTLLLRFKGGQIIRIGYCTGVGVDACEFNAILDLVGVDPRAAANRFRIARRLLLPLRCYPTKNQETVDFVTDANNNQN
jgi:hypothetical protein